VMIARLDRQTPVAAARDAVKMASALGTNAIMAESGCCVTVLSSAPVCASCGAWFDDLKPVHFHTPCPHCGGDGCKRCDATGLHPQAAAVYWHGVRLPDLLTQIVDEARALFDQADLPAAAERLCSEITRRLDALEQVGLGYLGLD